MTGFNLSWEMLAMMVLPPQVNTVLKQLESAGYEAFLVGGAVRDYVRDGSTAKDWDIATNALPEQVKQVFFGYHLIETGLKHGTVTVMIDHEPLEITTYRIDGDYTDHRHPDAVQFTGSLREDMERRDFTMNALAYHPQTGVVDLVGGKADIAKGIVRCVGDPDRRFREDGLRMLRGLRFAAVYGMHLEAHTAAAIHRNRELLHNIAAERVQIELTKLLCGTGAAEILRDFADVIAVPVPELVPMFGLEQHNPYHDKNVWEHTVAVVDSVRPDPVLRWAALLHDVGKSLCFTMGDDGCGHFYGHAARSMVIAEDVLSRLRFDHIRKEQIVHLVRYHDMPIAAEKRLIRRLLSRHGEKTTRQLIELHRADVFGQSDICRPRLAELDEAANLVDDMLNKEACFSLKDLAIRGNDVMTLGFRGREIALALQMCLDAVLDEQVSNDTTALLAFLAERENE